MHIQIRINEMIRLLVLDDACTLIGKGMYTHDHMKLEPKRKLTALLIIGVIWTTHSHSLCTVTEVIHMHPDIDVLIKT